MTLPRYIIRTIRLAHCKKGPARCANCREMDVDKVCLLDICPPHPGQVQRRVIEVELKGERAWREFDIVKAFASEQEARAYAAANGLETCFEW